MDGERIRVCVSFFMKVPIINIAIVSRDANSDLRRHVRMPGCLVCALFVILRCKTLRTQIQTSSWLANLKPAGKSRKEQIRTRKL